MSDYETLTAQRAEIDRQIAEVLSTERKAAIQQAKELALKYKIRPGEMFPSKRSTKGAKVEPKYRDANTGATWAGRGIRPNWLPATGDISSYLI